MNCECTPGGDIGTMLGKDGHASPFGNGTPNSLSGPMSPFSLGLGALVIQHAKTLKLKL